MAKLTHYLLQLFVAIDQLGNALIGGYADETISSRAYRAEFNGKRWGKIWRPVIDKVFFFQKNHCEKAFVSEHLRLQFPTELRVNKIS